MWPGRTLDRFSTSLKASGLGKLTCITHCTLFGDLLLSWQNAGADAITRIFGRVEGLLKDLERDVERRERFLRFWWSLPINIVVALIDLCQEILRMNDASFICFLLRECGRMVGAFPELEEEVRFLEIKKMSRSISFRCQCRLYCGARAVVGKSLTKSWQTFDWSNWPLLPLSCGIQILLCLFVCLFVPNAKWKPGWC